VAHQVPHEPAVTAGRPRKVLILEFGDRGAQRCPRACEEAHGRKVAVRGPDENREFDC
jgi:hypothetical protein